MRSTSHIGLVRNAPHVVPLRPAGNQRRNRQTLAAIRGLVIALVASALLWGIGISVVWFWHLRH